MRLPRGDGGMNKLRHVNERILSYRTMQIDLLRLPGICVIVTCTLFIEGVSGVKCTENGDGTVSFNDLELK